MRCCGRQCKIYNFFRFWWCYDLWAKRNPFTWGKAQRVCFARVNQNGVCLEVAYELINVIYCSIITLRYSNIMLHLTFVSCRHCSEIYRDWLSEFMKRHPAMSIRSARFGRSLTHINGFNRQAIDHFFVVLKCVLQSGSLNALNIWSCDETGFSTEARVCKVVSTKGNGRTKTAPLVAITTPATIVTPSRGVDGPQSNAIIIN